MAGHGWHMTGKSEIKRKPCKCGAGFVVTYEEECERDYPPFDKTETSKKCECSNKCE